MKKKISALLMAVVLVLACTACAGASMDMMATESSTAASYNTAGGYYEKGYEEIEVESAEAIEFEEEEGLADVTTSGVDMPQDGRKIIRNTTMTIETKTFDESVTLLKQAVGSVNGYIEYSSVYAGGRTQSAEYTCRVPADQYSAFLQNVQGAGSIVSTEESTEDATAQYVDMESRLKSLRTQEQRLLELMEESGSLEELLAVQDKLMEVQYQIESYTAQMNVLSDRIDYATVYIYLEEVEVYTPVEPTFGERIADAFTGMLTGVKNGAQNLVLAVIYLIPLWILGGLAAVIIVMLVKRHKRKAPKNTPPYYPPVNSTENHEPKQ
ncbi:MAG: DUF4349 domain-containing protein [Clostridia bacterium]|nr:DUF4349 domain-containing protein [Clostridia bacterium]